MAIHHLRVHSTLDVTPLQMRCIDAVVKSVEQKQIVLRKISAVSEGVISCKVTFFMLKLIPLPCTFEFIWVECSSVGVTDQDRCCLSSVTLRYWRSTMWYYSRLVQLENYSRMCQITTWHAQVWMVNWGFVSIRSNFWIFLSILRSSGLDVFPVTLDDTDSQNCYKLLQPWEQNSYIFQIVYHGDRTKHKVG